MSQQGKIVLIGGAESALTDAEYQRFRRMGEKSGMYQILESGVIINREQIAAVFPGDMDKIQATNDMAPPEIVQSEANGEAGFEPDQVEYAGELLTGEDIERIVTASGLTQAAFAATVGYSPASIRMAIKENRASRDLSAAILKKYSSYLDGEKG